MLVRPEAIDIAPDPAGNATVVSASFLGAHAKVIATTDDGQRVAVQVDSDAVTSYRPGDRVRVRPQGDPALAVAKS